jgi:hypothetical protein
VENIPADIAFLGVFGEWVFDADEVRGMTMMLPFLLSATLVIQPVNPADAGAGRIWSIDGGKMLYICSDPAEKIDGVFMLTIEGNSDQNLINLINSRGSKGNVTNTVSIFPNVKADIAAFPNISDVQTVVFKGRSVPFAGKTAIGSNETIELALMVMGTSQGTGGGYPKISYKADGIDLVMNECARLEPPAQQKDALPSDQDKRADAK